MSCTVRDVSRLAGVSPSTVSRVLSRPEMVSTETRERVLAAACKLGWRPNRLARSLTNGATQNIGVVVPDIVNPFFPPLIRGAQQEAWKRGFSVLLGDSDENPERELHMASEFVTQVDGLLLMSSRLPPQQILSLREHCEVVLLNRIVRDLPSVLIDTAAGVREAVRYLAQAGHKTVHYVSGPEYSWSNRQRLAALKAECAAVGLSCSIVARGVGAFDHGRACVSSLLARRATAVLAYDDITAIGILAGLAERSVRVPEELSVIGCDDIMTASQLGLTTISAPCEEVGTIASGLLIDRVVEHANGTGRQRRVLRVPSALVLRNTAGPVPGNRRVRRSANDVSGKGGKRLTPW